jgi:hypothetical protein
MTQERETTNIIIPTLQHANNTHFILNMHALHNAHLVRQVLPQSLVAPSHIYHDWQTFHDNVAAQVWEFRHGRRMANAQRRAAKVVASQASKRSQAQHRASNSHKGISQLAHCDNYDQMSDSPPEDSEDEYHEKQRWSDEGEVSAAELDIDLATLNIRSRRARVIQKCQRTD